MSFTDPLRAAVDAVERYRSTVDGSPALPPADLEPLRQRVRSYSFEAPLSEEQLIEDVAEMLGEWAVQTPNPRYMGLFNPDVMPMSVAADAIVAGFNPQLAAYSHNPAANEIERHTFGLFLRLAGIPEGTGSFTSGGSEANQSAVVAALTDRIKDFADSGKSGQPTLYVSAEAHHSFIKVAHMCGIGRSAVRQVPVDRALRMDMTQLADMVESDRWEGRTAFMVVGTAGTTSAGATDPLPKIAAFCKENELWFHVDAAWAGAALLSPTLSLHLAGIEHADSITIDAHKWLSVPMGAGMFLCRNPEVVREAFSIKTAYMPSPLDAPDPYHNSIQWSRRFIGLKVFMALAATGIEGYARQLEHQAEMADYLSARLEELGWTIEYRSPYAMCCFNHPEVPAAEVARRVQERRQAWVSHTTLSHTGSVVRACITNFRTTRSDVDAVVEELCLALR